MENIAKHMELVDEIRNSELAERHEKEVEEGYKAFEAELEQLFEKHFPAIFERDQRLIAETAVVIGKPSVPNFLTFTVITSTYMSSKVNNVLGNWLAKKLEILVGNFR